ncbi:MAG: hypothetical protein H0W34_08075 [Pyrinomonadaceae bacterium]|nr:hypothetical protein [Pyrinomonadaceae bacterium]
MNLEREGKPLTEIRRTIEERYDPKNGMDTRTPRPPAAKGREQ